MNGFRASCELSTSNLLELERDRQYDMLELPEPIIYNITDEIIEAIIDARVRDLGYVPPLGQD